MHREARREGSERDMLQFGPESGLEDSGEDRLDNLERESGDTGEDRLDNLTRELEDGDKLDSGIDRFEKKSNAHFESTYGLKPNEDYEVNEYYYETDRYGRIIRCEGTLRLEDGKRNTDHQKHAGGKDRLESDEGGHLIARRFGGSEKIDNLVPMDSQLNQVEYKEIEDDWAENLEKGNVVDVQIKCKYIGDSTRPDSFIVTYQLSDEKGVFAREKKILHNGKSGGV